MRWYFKISGDFKDFDVDRLSGWIFVLDFFDFGFDQKQKSLKRALGKRGKEFAKNQNLDLLKVQAKSKKVRLIVIKKLHLDHEKPVLIDHQTYTNIFKTPPIYWKWVLDLLKRPLTLNFEKSPWSKSESRSWSLKHLYKKVTQYDFLTTHSLKKFRDQGFYLQ